MNDDSVARDILVGLGRAQGAQEPHCDLCGAEIHGVDWLVVGDNGTAWVLCSWDCWDDWYGGEQ